MDKGTGKVSYKTQRKNERIAEAARKRKMRNMMFIAGSIIIIAAIVIAIMQSNKPKSGNSFDYATHPTIGQPSAAIKMVEFGDFKCSSCKIFATQVYPQLKKDFIDTGKVQLSFYNFPFIAADSMNAAVAAQFIYHQKPADFWTYYDALYNQQPDNVEKTIYATSDYLVNLAKKANISVDYRLMKQDIDQLTYKSEVNADYNKGTQVGVQGTPTLFINGKQYAGNFADYSSLKAALQKANP